MKAWIVDGRDWPEEWEITRRTDKKIFYEVTMYGGHRREEGRLIASKYGRVFFSLDEALLFMEGQLCDKVSDMRDATKSAIKDLDAFRDRCRRDQEAL